MGSSHPGVLGPLHVPDPIQPEDGSMTTLANEQAALRYWELSGTVGSLPFAALDLTRRETLN